MGRLFDGFHEAYAAQRADESALREQAILAMGFMAGKGLPGAHAAVVLLYERAWPDAKLPHLAAAIIAPPEA